MSSLFLGPRWVGDLCPMPLPQPLRMFQQCVDDSSDVGEAPSWGPLLFQDVVGLTQEFTSYYMNLLPPCEVLSQF